MKIFICDDNKAHLNSYKEYIQNILFIEEIDMEINLVTQNPYDILDYLKQNDVNGLYFLDVDLKSKINGIQLGEKIREYDPRGFIVFITTHAEMSYLTFKYKVEAMDYIIKDEYSNIKKRIYDCIIKSNNRYSSKENTIHKIFTFENGGQINNIEYYKILFFETSHNAHKIILHTLNRQVEFYGKLKDIEKELDDRFCRCHNSLIVNTNNIKKIDRAKRILHMSTDQELNASVRGIKELYKIL